MAQIDRYLKTAVTQKASDLHLSAGESVRLRIDGDLVPVNVPTFDCEKLLELLFEILTEEEQQKLLAHRNIDKSYSVPGVGNFRINMFFTRRGIGAVMRTIPSNIPSIAELGLPDSLERLCDLAKGLVLVTGPTGSGKSTTLAALIGYINQIYPYHILTAEDPIEFIHTSHRSLINQREIGNHCPTFSDALKYALREDPDVILVGEMRDLETISLAITAAETGHLVFGTLHTRGAASSIARIIDSFPGTQQGMIRTMLAEALVAVVSQALLKRADGKGRVAAYEIMIVNHAISNLIREGKNFQIPSVIQTARKEGMILMDQHLVELLEKGLVKPEEVEPYMEDLAALAKYKVPRTNAATISKQVTTPPNSLSKVAPIPQSGKPQQPGQMRPSNAIPPGKTPLSPPPSQVPKITLPTTVKTPPPPIPKGPVAAPKGPSNSPLPVPKSLSLAKAPPPPQLHSAGVSPPVISNSPTTKEEVTPTDTSLFGVDSEEVVEVMGGEDSSASRQLEESDSSLDLPPLQAEMESPDSELPPADGEIDPPPISHIKKKARG